MPGLVIHEDGAERLAGVDRVADLLVEMTPDGRVDDRIDTSTTRPPGASSRDRSARAARPETYPPRARLDLDLLTRGRQEAGVVDDARVAPLCGDHARNRSRAEPSAIVLRQIARASSRVAARPPITTISAASSRERSTRSAGPLAAEAVDALGDLDGVAHSEAERLVHPGDQGTHPLAEPPADRAHRLRQAPGVVEPLA